MANEKGMGMNNRSEVREQPHGEPMTGTERLRSFVRRDIERRLKPSEWSSGLFWDVYEATQEPCQRRSYAEDTAIRRSFKRGR